MLFSREESPILSFLYRNMKMNVSFSRYIYDLQILIIFWSAPHSTWHFQAVQETYKKVLHHFSYGKLIRTMSTWIEALLPFQWTLEAKLTSGFDYFKCIGLVILSLCIYLLWHVLQYLKNSLIQLTLIFFFYSWNSQKKWFQWEFSYSWYSWADSTTDRFCIGLCSSVMTVMSQFTW